MLRWEPSFHQGLIGPSLRSVLRRGMAYPWGLHTEVEPGSLWMLTSDLFSPPVFMRIIRTDGSIDQRSGEAMSPCCFARSVSWSYSFPSFHIRRTTPAILRARVSLARFGLVPAAVNR